MQLKELFADLQINNLCNYYILPLIGLSIDDFGSGAFKNSYINREGTVLYVVVIDEYLLNNPTKIGENESYQGKMVSDMGTIFIFHIPKKWLSDVQCFIQSRYSRCSSKAKEIIKALSGLSYQEVVDPITVLTDPRLLALDRDPVLINYWQEELGVSLSPDSELLPTFNISNFMEIS